MASDFYGFDPPIGWRPDAGTIRLFAFLAQSADPLRVGTGFGKALYEPDLPDYCRLEYASNDVVRGGTLFLMMASPAAGRFGVGEIPKDGPGVYDIKPSGGRYIGQSFDMEERSGSHFTPSGKFSGQTPGNSDSFGMHGSTELEREVYEQYRIDEADIDTLQNVRNPMGGRRDLYKQMIEGVIRKYNLPR